MAVGNDAKADLERVKVLLVMMVGNADADASIWADKSKETIRRFRFTCDPNVCFNSYTRVSLALSSVSQ
jgi:hypothetical protein